MKREDIEKQLNLLERVAEKLKNGLITSGNVAHDGKVQGYTIENVVSNIREILDEEKQREQKHAEWSDEDRLIQMAAFEILMASPKLVAFTILKESVIVWFKSLKDRIVLQAKQEWKPTKEQMKAFENVYNWYRDNSNFAPSMPLLDLYKDLKKLKEK